MSNPEAFHGENEGHFFVGDSQSDLEMTVVKRPYSISLMTVNSYETGKSIQTNQTETNEPSKPKMKDDFQTATPRKKIIGIAKYALFFVACFLGFVALLIQNFSNTSGFIYEGF